MVLKVIIIASILSANVHSCLFECYFQRKNIAQERHFHRTKSNLGAVMKEPTKLLERHDSKISLSSDLSETRLSFTGQPIKLNPSYGQYISMEPYSSACWPHVPKMMKIKSLTLGCILFTYCTEKLTFSTDLLFWDTLDIHNRQKWFCFNGSTGHDNAIISWYNYQKSHDPLELNENFWAIELNYTRNPPTANVILETLNRHLDSFNVSFAHNKPSQSQVLANVLHDMGFLEKNPTTHYSLPELWRGMLNDMVDVQIQQNDRDNLEINLQVYESSVRTSEFFEWLTQSPTSDLEITDDSSSKCSSPLSNASAKRQKTY